ncbi:ankyrin repeat domain-containing protein, partial [Enterococcus casseliflavus]|uniref:ankyrin repeat domain-containing protein n=1 Tax=Enterococcus casseliflavus TaxID=37734 RepID=UPI003D0AC8D9
YGETPLMLAVSHQDAATVRALIRAKAQVNAVDQDGVSALWMACELGDAGVISALLDAGADIRRARADGSSALHVCARFAPTS